MFFWGVGFWGDCATHSRVTCIKCLRFLSEPEFFIFQDFQDSCRAIRLLLPFKGREQAFIKDKPPLFTLTLPVRVDLFFHLQCLN